MSDDSFRSIRSGGDKGGIVAAFASLNKARARILQSVTSKLKASDGRDFPFTKAILTLRNVCEAEVGNVVTNQCAS